MANQDGHRAADDDRMRRLFDLARDLRDRAPWTGPVPRPLCGIRCLAETETYFICLMGFDAHRPGLTAYRGDQGYHHCRRDGGQWDDPLELLFQVMHLSVVYMDRDQLRKEERQLIHRLGLKFRNRFHWPAFRSYTPGYVSWRLSCREADHLID
ncbi:hypothetical protein JXA80_02875, partial [bacterium]|nr:hypothetical protein [candidate division CSSED10-310 bacterium]